MRAVEKTVIHPVALVSNLDYRQPLDRSGGSGAMVSKLNYIKPEDPPVESGVFQEADGVFFKGLMR